MPFIPGKLGKSGFPAEGKEFPWHQSCSAGTEQWLVPAAAPHLVSKVKHNPGLNFLDFNPSIPLLVVLSRPSRRMLYAFSHDPTGLAGCGL